MSCSHSTVVAPAPFRRELVEPVPSALPGSLEMLTRTSVGVMVMLPNRTGATRSLEDPHLFNSIAATNHPPIPTITASPDSDTHSRNRRSPPCPAEQ